MSMTDSKTMLPEANAPTSSPTNCQMILIQFWALSLPYVLHNYKMTF
jgi:hypothetical protein